MPRASAAIDMDRRLTDCSCRLGQGASATTILNQWHSALRKQWNFATSVIKRSIVHHCMWYLYILYDFQHYNYYIAIVIVINKSLHIYWNQSNSIIMIVKWSTFLKLTLPCYFNIYINIIIQAAKYWKVELYSSLRVAGFFNLITGKKNFFIQPKLTVTHNLMMILPLYLFFGQLFFPGQGQFTNEITLNLNQNIIQTNALVGNEPRRRAEKFILYCEKML